MPEEIKAMLTDLEALSTEAQDVVRGLWKLQDKYAALDLGRDGDQAASYIAVVTRLNAAADKVTGWVQDLRDAVEDGTY